ncbi:putative toxin-antitoxin system toxin component, PIN family [Candidatus Roizmanbacteria bacterium RIFCSPLOWO2_01_FULL_38_12]|uniref:Putative toxin-antitoxin system toxin component, PIN family n=1 Tax=Candidatus Roizmanbacteria bacterium RIFCSPLOWO2_01_FULL_38_12 TaxID=1802061 RepID=A0A1F7IY56_9BACT|nr:MAG: putative toxin-antitoxin system toxin component, PIN family [Candidatus Roizmanbacteria bacterium RIFCSPHIGHO2_01_FULL_38_15]OGK34454.1 MAG: putative toxin-antitoxin system toxin component, PIN family [Candidatus Roizmanbacteria bacterium RIFCSPHIGHO2_12_FULL_38_13]OGK48284.1 MAG: putative toxin-antitoxin system toxin component, PIN family [Candidatus Roizmanbacteria bacterium RIFCSPLOWO2_01_FULL_38_12]
MHKVILDPNIILSGALFGGIPAALLKGIQQKKFELCLSVGLYTEIFDKLIYKFGVDQKILEDVTELLNIGILYNTQALVSLPQDTNDAYLLDLAEESNADYLVTGDKKHLLPLKKWKKTQIISARQAKNILLKDKKKVSVLNSSAQ